MIIVTTAGWSIPRAHAGSFPGSGTQLTRFAQVFRGVEIDTSAYRDHSVATYANWARQVPRNFRFAVKLPQRITHDAQLRATRIALEEFLHGVAGLGKRLGPLLVQLPPSLQFDARVARKFFTLLRARHDGEAVCEPRHASWFEPAADRLLVRYRIARVAADPAVVPTAARPGGWPEPRYWRLHGSPRKYWSVYEPRRVTDWVHALQALPPRSSAWCVFDNTAGGGAIGNALQACKALKPQ